MDIIRERTLALAGVLQACHEVQSLARNGEMHQEAYESSLRSILVLDAVSTPAVYGGVAGVKRGLALMADGIMQSTSGNSLEVLRYATTILELQTKLARDPQEFARFATDVERLSSSPDDELAEACSQLYQTHVSKLRPQVIVQGEEEHLQNTDIPPKIRTLLLAAIRSAVLWKQKGGGRFRLVWERTRMTNAACSMLKSV